MTATARPVDGPAADRPAAHAEGIAGPRLRLVRVATPQPPPSTVPVQLVLPGVPVPRAAYRPGPRPRQRTGPVDDDFGPAPTDRADLPDPAAAGRQLLTLVVEVLGGRRPASQLQTLTSPGLLAALSRGRRPAWCATRAPLVLGRVHVCEPVDGVAEVCAVARTTGRSHALAARLEGRDGRWCATALHVG